MTERENLPAVIAAQAVAVLSEKRDSLVARGLAALRKDNNALYRQAREVFNQGRTSSWNAADNPDVFAALKILQQLADHEYGKAYYPLSRLYLRYQNIEEDKKHAKHYAQLAFDWCLANQANQDMELWCDLGHMYRLGHGAEKDNQQAVYWFRKAAEQGDARGQVILGYMHSLLGHFSLGKNHNIEQDDKQAVYWTRKAADQGNAQGQWLLGCMYEFGDGVEKNYQFAVYWFRMAAEQGNASGQRKLGEMYREGHGVEKNYIQSVYWFRKAAEQGDALAQVELGVMYSWTGRFFFGKGSNIKDAPELAAYWFRKAAEQGNADGQWHLGSGYEFGLGVDKNPQQSVYWYRKAAEQGHANGQLSLADMYSKGHGIDRNEEEALYWNRKAAEQGFSKSQEAFRKLQEVLILIIYKDSKQ